MAPIAGHSVPGQPRKSALSHACFGEMRCKAVQIKSHPSKQNIVISANAKIYLKKLVETPETHSDDPVRIGLGMSMSRRGNILPRAVPGQGKSAWTCAVRIPRADALDELSYSAQCIEIMRPLLPVPGGVLLLFSAYITAGAWPVASFAQAAWLALSLTVSASTLSGREGYRACWATTRCCAERSCAWERSRSACCSAARGWCFRRPPPRWPHWVARLW